MFKPKNFHHAGIAAAKPPPPANIIRACYNGGMDKEKIRHFGGYWLKPVYNAQIEAAWNGGMLDAFLRLGENHPDIASEIYAVADKP